MMSPNFENQSQPLQTAGYNSLSQMHIIHSYIYKVSKDYYNFEREDNFVNDPCSCHQHRRLNKLNFL